MMRLVIICTLLYYALVPNLLTPCNLDEQHPAEALQWSNLLHLMGTNNFGRDIFSRIICSARTSIMAGFITVGFTYITSILIDAAAGCYGGKAGNALMCLMDVLMATPNTLLAISIIAALGPGSVNLMVTVGISMIPSYAKAVCVSVLAVKDREYIEVAWAGGASDLRIILCHIPLNCSVPAIVCSTLGAASAILTCASLGYIGLNIQPPTPEWGNMLDTGKAYLLNEWYMVLFPGLAIMTVILALSLLSDELWDALGPRIKR